MDWLTILPIDKGWKHPKENGNYLLDTGYEMYFEDSMRWIGDFQCWALMTPDEILEKDGIKGFVEMAGFPPDREDYLDFPDGDSPYYQIFQTDLSDYLPFSPMFKNIEAMRPWLIRKSIPLDVIDRLMETYSVKYFTEVDDDVYRF